MYNAQSVVLDRNNAGGTIRRDFLDPKLGDPAVGAVEVAKAALEKNADGDWVPSDGKVKFGDMAGEERTLEFVVRMPRLPAAAVYDEDGRLIETVVNVAVLSWQEQEDVSTQRRAAANGTKSIRSNEVAITLVDQPNVLDTPPVERPETAKKPGQLLPDAGAPAHSGLFGAVGSLALLLGTWLMLVSRGRGYLPQR